jgi:hypothetical protein
MMQRRKEMIGSELIVLQGLYHINLHERRESLRKWNRIGTFCLWHVDDDGDFEEAPTGISTGVLDHR